MKILLIGNSKIVFAKELKNELVSLSIDVSLLDFEFLTMFDKNNEEFTAYSERFKKYKNIPKLSMFFRMLYIKNIIKDNDFDIVNIHVSRWYYLFILQTIVKQKLVITFYGSDFYRTSKLVKNIQKIIYKKADIVTFTNPSTKDSFLKYYNDFKNKLYVCRFGLKTLDYIDANRKISQRDIKKCLGYNQKKLIITCGYNSTEAQQHEKIIQAIVELPKQLLNNIQFIFPMTYGNITYKEKIKNILKMTSIDYVLLEEFLYQDDNAYVKLASDIMINILQTDSFSGSMQEFLYAKNIVITASWLPYDLFDKEGIVYYKIDEDNELTKKLESVINNYEELKKNLNVNITIISKLSSWKNNIKSWVDIYEN